MHFPLTNAFFINFSFCFFFLLLFSFVAIHSVTHIAEVNFYCGRKPSYGHITESWRVLHFIKYERAARIFFCRLDHSIGYFALKQKKKWHSSRKPFLFITRYLTKHRRKSSTGLVQKECGYIKKTKFQDRK